MIAHEVDRRQSRDRRPGGEQRNDAGAVRTQVDVVAEMHQHRRCRLAPREVTGNRTMQLL